MEKIWLGAFLVITCFLLLAWMYRRHRSWIANFILRACAGLLLIHIVNWLLEWRGIGLEIGLNPVTAGVAGLLGVPGIAVMYGIVLYFY